MKKGLRDHCLRMIRECATDHFGNLLLIIRNWILNRCVVVPAEGKMTKILLINFKIIFIIVKSDEWELMKRFITAVLQASYQLELATPEVRQEYLKLFDAILRCSANILDASASSLLNGVLSILSSLYPVFDDFPDRIPCTLNHVLFIHKSILL